jgi:type II secretory pathway component GspD/PulD (secretin)
MDSNSIIRNSIEALNKGELEKASAGFNKALMMDTGNSYLQFLNAITYHLMAKRGDSSKYALAEQGYDLAIKFDRSNWLARYQLGLLKLDNRQFAQAQQVLSEALLYNNRDGDLLYSTVVASYFSKDLVTANGVLSKLMELEGKTERVLRTQVMLSASLGESQDASRQLQEYSNKYNADDISNLTKRLSDWNNFYQQYKRGVNAGLFEKDIQKNNSERILETDVQNSQNNKSENSVVVFDAEQAVIEEGEIPLDSNSRMVIVDVVILRTEETVGSTKGLNILSGLKLQFGALGDESSAAYNRSRTNTTLTDDGSLSTSISNSIVSSITVPALNYSLNIFNSSNGRSEVLARPTLVASFGERSTFFSGSEIEAAAVSRGDGGAVSIQKEVGIKLSILPTQLEGGLIGLNIEAERTFLKAPSGSVQFEFKLETSKTNVNANVFLRSGETLLLSGLSEKESQVVRDGVPFLQDIPVIQYLFSEKSTVDFEKSVLILVTPRLPNYIYQDDITDSSGNRKGTVSELQAKYSDWFKPSPNWASMFNHMQSNSLYREFRTGDVTMEKWQSQQSFSDRIKKAASFLYY